MTNAAYNVLVVDDDHLVRTLIVQALSRRPELHLDEAGSAAEAMALLQTHTYDLVLSDVRMEAATAGVELLRTIKQRSPSTAVILLTAYGTLSTAVGALRERADNFLLKPLSLAELDASVASALDRRANVVKQQTTLQRVLHTLQGALCEKPELPTQELDYAGGGTSRYLSAGDIRLDTFKHQATVHGTTISLTATEWTILHVLLTAQRHVVTFEQLVAQTHNVQTARDSARELIASHIRNLRRKLGPSGSRLMNVRGIGFCLMAEDA